jgi:hypothetical protein
VEAIVGISYKQELLSGFCFLYLYDSKSNLPTLNKLTNGRRKTAQNSIEVDAKTKESTWKTEEKLSGRNKEGHERKEPK